MLYPPRRNSTWLDWICALKACDYFFLFAANPFYTFTYAHLMVIDPVPWHDTSIKIHFAKHLCILWQFHVSDEPFYHLVHGPIIH